MPGHMVRGCFLAKTCVTAQERSRMVTSRKPAISSVLDHLCTKMIVWQEKHALTGDRENVLAPCQRVEQLI